MIRNVVLAKLKDGYDAAELAQIQQGLRELNCPGTVAYSVGSDAGLREGNWDFVIVADFTDVDAYRGYDADAEHNALRARLAPMVEQIARAQMDLPA
ncbi:Dabb family protein [Mycolicibacterium obuense]|uniref:Dabb family protein n=1 Tax=Mycolicibacterium obuense TaxID=1807 RepID=A0A0J6WDD1_9MYCO|nr:Dabb family protein [Mycolicibacterium obuense]KMO79973.1 Stress responsive A/B Barrel Domain protein [Mycolicibacterium obuense]OKH61934.1 stress protein [Mycobacterium sp. SWH-M1]TDL07422.1 Dabb family protein [Mycolicibacterium obuense]